MKPQLVTADYIFFLDDLELFKMPDYYEPYGGAEDLLNLPVKNWTRVNVALGEDVEELGMGQVSMDQKEKWFAVGGSFPRDHTHPALIGTRAR